MTSNIRDPFDAPIPGQSLTGTPGNKKWEHPPQYTKIDEASEAVWELIHDPQKLEQILLLLDSGVSVEALAKGILFSGFVEGKWSVDLSMLLAEVVFNQIMAIGMRAKLKNMRILIGDHTNSKFKRELSKFMAGKDRDLMQKKETAVEKIKEDIQKAPRGLGLMAGGY